MDARDPIVVGYDGRPQSQDALALAEAVARPTGRRLVLVWVEPVGPLDLPFETVFEPIQEKAEAALRLVADQVRERGIAAEARVGLLGSAAQGLTEFAEQESAALVVIGSSDRGLLGRVFAGSVGRVLLHSSPCPVAVAPRGLAEAGPPTLARIGVGYDGSPESQGALAWAEEFASLAGATLRLLVVPEEHLSAERVLEDAIDRVSEVQATGKVRRGPPASLLEAHSETVDLLVVGSRGYGPLRRVLLGSVASRLLGHSHSPVVVTPRAAVERRRSACANEAADHEPYDDAVVEG